MRRLRRSLYHWRMKAAWQPLWPPEPTTEQLSGRWVRASSSSTSLRACQEVSGRPVAPLAQRGRDAVALLLRLAGADDDLVLALAPPGSDPRHRR